MVLVKYNAKNVYTCSNVRLIPGVNQVEDGLLKSALTHPLFLRRVESGIIEIIEQKNQGNAKKEDPKQLSKLMKDVYDVKLLRRYIATSEDKEVIKAAKKQLKKIEDVPLKEEVEVGFSVK